MNFPRAVSWLSRLQLYLMSQVNQMMTQITKSPIITPTLVMMTKKMRILKIATMTNNNQKFFLMTHPTKKMMTLKRKMMIRPMLKTQMIFLNQALQIQQPGGNIMKVTGSLRDLPKLIETGLLRVFGVLSTTHLCPTPRKLANLSST